MQEERSRHRIEVQELEGIQAQMMEELEVKEGRIAELEAQSLAYEKELEAGILPASTPYPIPPPPP